MEIDVFTFAGVSADRGGVHADLRLPELVEEIELVDEVGLDVLTESQEQPPLLTDAPDHRTIVETLR
jgi:hypothetical protein